MGRLPGIQDAAGSWVLGDHLFCPKPPLCHGSCQQAVAGGGEEAANPGQREVSFFSTVTTGAEREPCGLGSGVLEQASSQFQLSWAQELLRPAALCGGCYLLVGEHPVAAVTQGSTRQEASHKARSRALPAAAWL